MVTRNLFPLDGSLREEALLDISFSIRSKIRLILGENRASFADEGKGKRPASRPVDSLAGQQRQTPPRESPARQAQALPCSDRWAWGPEHRGAGSLPFA